jgi:hypothetical protein
MQRARRDWSGLSRVRWMIFLGVAPAVACASQPPSHDHGGVHPPLCTDTSSSAALARDKPMLFPDGGMFPLSATSLFPVGSLAALSGQPLSSTLSISVGHKILGVQLIDNQRDNFWPVKDFTRH